jgi:hypothetical protein
MIINYSTFFFIYPSSLMHFTYPLQIHTKNQNQYFKKKFTKTVLFLIIFKKNKKNIQEINNIIRLNFLTLFLSQKFVDFFTIIEIFSLFGQKRNKSQKLQDLMKITKICEISLSESNALKFLPFYLSCYLFPKLCFSYLTSHPHLNLKKTLLQKKDFLKKY